MSVRVQLDGPVEQFTSATVISADLPGEDDDDALSSDDEIFKDVRAYLRQTMGKHALVRAEAGICGGGEENTAEQSRTATPWLEGMGNYVTVRHPPPDAPIDTPPLPGMEDGAPRPIVHASGLTYALPLTYRHWFDPRMVADLERSELGTFGVTEGVYREIRDKIIDAYNVDPSKFLSVRNAREATGFGEIGTLTKVWGFLDYWGIINYLADPSTAPRFSKKLIDFPIGRPNDRIKEIKCSVCHKACHFTAFVLRSEAAPLIPREQVSMARFCSGCINTGAYPPFFTRASFEQIDVVLPGTVTPDFSEEDTMRLVEAVDRYGADWHAVANMVSGGKTAAQCLLHFAQIPIFDRFMADVGGPPPCVPKPNPFRDESNPLLSVLTLLSTAVPAHLAGEAARMVAKAEDVKDHSTKMEES